MKTSLLKKKYEAPSSVDLSGLTAIGDDENKPLGTCTNGFYPYSGCNQGADVNEGSCTPTGTVPDTGNQCRPFGTTADSDCSGGGYQ